MTTRAITTRLGLAVASTMLAAALLLGFQAPDGTITRTPGSDTQAGGTSGASSVRSGTSSGSGSTPSTGSSSSGSSVVDGPVVTTRFGPVQVEITVSGGKIVKVTALQLPTGGHSGRISDAVESTLASEALAAQSASIDTISGATYTSLAYQRSLQAAIDQAGI